MPLAQVKLEWDMNCAVARLEGEIDISNAPELEAELAEAVPNEALALVVDLSRTTYLDSAGVKLLISLARRLRRRGQQLRVVVPDKSLIGDVLRVTDLGVVAPLRVSVEEALSEIGAESEAALSASASATTSTFSEESLVTLDLEVETKYLGTQVHLAALAGDFDVRTASAFEEELGELIRKDARAIIVDLSGIAFLDSTGLAALVAGSERLRSRAGELVVVTSDRRLLDLFEITGLDRLFPILATLEEAIARAAAGEAATQ